MKHEANALIGFSIGQDSAKIEVLKQDLKLAAQKYNTYTILAADTLQRFTRMVISPISEQTAYDDALAVGDTWVRNAIEIADGLGVPYKILRWDDVVRFDEFKEIHKQVRDLYEQDKAFQKAVKQTIGKFLTRYQKNGIIKNTKEAIQKPYELCLKYVLEECAAVLMLGNPEYGYTHLQYHYSLGEAMLYICKLVQNVDEELLQPVIASDLTKNPAKSLFFKPSSPVKINSDPYQLGLKMYVDSMSLHVKALIDNTEYPDDYKREALKAVYSFIGESLAHSFNRDEQRNSL